MDSNERPKIVLVNRCIIAGPESKTLILERSSQDIHNPGEWEFPGGKLDTGQDLSHALEREVLEETGLLIEPISRLVFAESYVIGNGKYAGMPYVALFGLGRVVGGTLTLSSEHTQSAWVSFDEALETNLTFESRKALIVIGKAALTLE
jgi:8-oxo-dGTP pyrophosphatase MutT (NUDIX family)